MITETKVGTALGKKSLSTDFLKIDELIRTYDSFFFRTFLIANINSQPFSLMERLCGLSLVHFQALQLSALLEATLMIDLETSRAVVKKKPRHRDNDRC